MWLDDEALGEHFERVRDRMKAGAKSEEWEDIPMEQNELTAGLRKGSK